MIRANAAMSIHSFTTFLGVDLNAGRIAAPLTHPVHRAALRTKMRVTA
jgi:hypothetical protein